MAYAEGVVRGHVYGGSGWQDCSRPCMWLDGGYCRLKKTKRPECLEHRSASFGEEGVFESAKGGRFQLKDGGF